jgi:hypothetical protein
MRSVSREYRIPNARPAGRWVEVSARSRWSTTVDQPGGGTGGDAEPPRDLRDAQRGAVRREHEQQSRQAKVDARRAQGFAQGRQQASGCREELGGGDRGIVGLGRLQRSFAGDRSLDEIRTPSSAR